MIKAVIGQDVEVARKILMEGDLVGIPTETVYGLAANAFDPTAVVKVFEVKNRPAFDPLIVHTFSIAKIREFVKEIPELAEELMQKFWPGPLTVLLKKRKSIPDLVTSGSALVAVRVPNHPLTLKLLASLDFPLAAPSANPFGYVSPTSAHHVNDQLGNRIRYILNGGPSNVGIESTIIGFDSGKPTIYRLGGISLEALEEVIGPTNLNLTNNSRPLSPGMLTSHYAPGKKVVLEPLEEILQNFPAKQIGLIRFSQPLETVPIQNQYILSESGDVSEAARNLFSALRHMDTKDIKIVVAELLPEAGLGRAINDRLRRAAVAMRNEE